MALSGLWNCRKSWEQVVSSNNTNNAPKSDRSRRVGGQYYVYVYIDPRNFEEFYFGKGMGSRKDAHLTDSSDSEKAKRIAAITKAGMSPIIRVIARDLSEHDALLIEKTLLWKLGRMLTNVSSGHYTENFRPHNSMHVKLSGFDFKAGIYYYNVGDGPCRSWEDYRNYGFISGGQGQRWKDAMCGFKEGDVVAAYLKNHGFVGIGRVIAEAQPARNVLLEGKPLLALPLKCQGMNANSESDDLCEYVAPVEWVASVERSEAKWERKTGLYTTTHVRASLDGQPRTIEFLENAFGTDMRALVT